MTVQDHIDKLTYKILTISDVSTIKIYLSSEYKDITLKEIRDIILKSASIAAYYDGNIVGCYLVDLTVHIDKQPTISVEYIKARYSEILVSLISKLNYIGSSNIQCSDQVLKYLNIVSRLDFVKLCATGQTFIDDALGVKGKVIKHFKRGFRLEFYDGSDKDELVPLIKEYHKERNPLIYSEKIENIDTYLSDDMDIYDTSIAIVRDSKTEEIAGFIRYAIVDEYGAIHPYVYGEYVYVVPKYRKGLTLSILYGYLCHIASLMNTTVRWDVYSGTNNQDIAVRVLKASRLTEGYILNSEQVKKLQSKYYYSLGVYNG